MLERLLHTCENELDYLDMAINCKKSCCIRIGPRCDVPCATVLSKKDNRILWMKELRYLGVYIVSSRLFKCNLHYAKRNFYRSANAIFGRIGRLSSEEVILQLFKSKCVPMLIYGLEVCPLRNSDLKYLSLIHI